MNTKRTNKDLTEAIAELLLERGAFAENPLTEQELAQRFGVSRTPVRDALSILQGRGVVERRQKRGVYLTRPSVAEVSEVFDLRAVLEGFAGSLATQNATAADLLKLSGYAEAFQDARVRGEQAACQAANVAFHNRIIELSGNSLLRTITDQFQVVQTTFRIAHSIEGADTRPRFVSPYPHALIVAKMHAGDADACAHALRSHILLAKQKLIERALGVRLESEPQITPHLGDPQP